MYWEIIDPLRTVKIGKALWMLTASMEFRTPLGKFTVPSGFIFDHASVPRVFTSIVPPVKSAIAEASVLHDWFYCKDSEDVPRKFADECLRELIMVNGGSKLLAFNAYTAVRVGAIRLYNKVWNKEKLIDAYVGYRMFEKSELINYLNIKE